MEDLKDFFINKTLAIVGNGMNVYNKNNGELIDGHDIVIRMNHVPMKNPKNEGKKTTIIAFTGGGRSLGKLNRKKLYKKFDDNDLKILALNNNGLTKIKRDNKGWENYFYVGDHIKEYCTSQTEAKPSAGYLTIHYINNHHKPKYVSVFGYDWKKTRSNWHPEVIKKDRNGDVISRHTHNWRKEEEICKAIIKSNKWELHP